MQVSGGWVMLQNIELVARWLPKLEKKLEVLIEGAHPVRCEEWNPPPVLCPMPPRPAVALPDAATPRRRFARCRHA
eukprot:2944899-Prymnesium_polylepis.1